MTHKTLTYILEYNGKNYPYSLTHIGVIPESDGEDVTRLTCKSANIDDEYLTEDIEGMIASLGEFIDDENTRKLKRILADIPTEQVINALFGENEARKTISLRLPERILALVRAKAEKKGMPYQTYITSVIHQDVIS